MSSPIDNLQDLTQKIDTEFAASSFEIFNGKRFGIKGCRVPTDIFYIQDLRDIFLRSKELSECATEQELDTCLGCSFRTIKEAIQTL